MHFNARAWNTITHNRVVTVYYDTDVTETVAVNKLLRCYRPKEYIIKLTGIISHTFVYIAMSIKKKMDMKN